MPKKTELAKFVDSVQAVIAKGRALGLSYRTIREILSDEIEMHKHPLPSLTIGEQLKLARGESVELSGDAKGIDILRNLGL